MSRTAGRVRDYDLPEPDGADELATLKKIIDLLEPLDVEIQEKIITTAAAWFHLSIRTA